jgi:hypothetical protein
MKKHKINLAITTISLLFFSCNESTKNIEQEKQSTICPCDSMGTFKEKGKVTTVCHLGKSMFKLEKTEQNDTVEITRFVYGKNTWKVQEYILFAKNSAVMPELWIYCDVKDSSDYLKLTFVQNDSIKRSDNDPVLDTFMGVNLITEKDTIFSKTHSISVKKEDVKGLMQFDKNVGGIYKGERGYVTSSIYIDGDIIKKYGSIINQYNIIKKACLKK